MKQLPLELPPTEPYALSYFVSHSGVIDAVTAFEQATQQVKQDPKLFQLICLCGPRGTGKSHLLEGFRLRATTELGIAADRCFVFEFGGNAGAEQPSAEELIPWFVSTYERLKHEGGLLLASVDESLLDAERANPHLRSRLRSGHLIRVDYPSEGEYKPLLRSLLERRNLSLSERDLDYLLERLPRDTLSFDQIFGKISQFSLMASKPARRGVIREVLEGEGEAR